MQKKMRKTRSDKGTRVGKSKCELLPKRSLVTVDDLLTRSDVNNTINILAEKKSHIKTLIAIYVYEGDTYGVINTDDVTNGDKVWYLELVKNDIFNNGEE